ncbi:MAG TPA: NAD-dependent epimerase/dehydratase family protein [Blastocatellia bacterium]|nr:NAD-dependent epimerase/dehydratase family protein [Blastocatellia bacterium]
MKFFITGASGFVGGAATAHFVGKGHEVVAMSRSAASDEKIGRIGAATIRCSLGEVPEAALAGCEAVIHAAAYVEEWGPYTAFYHVNVEGTHQLLQAARAAGVKRFIHIGTEAALFYGQDMVDVDESYPYPETPFYYSRTKQKAEKLVLAANAPGVFETVSVRPRMIWGPGDLTILPILMEKVRRRQFVWIDGGNYRTSTTHIDNLVHAIELALEKGRGGQAYFVTDGEVHLFREFITSLLATQGVEVKVGSMPRWLARSAGQMAESVWRTLGIKRTPPITSFTAHILSAHCVLNDAKAREELGYRPVISVSEGMRGLAKAG